MTFRKGSKSLAFGSAACAIALLGAAAASRPAHAANDKNTQQDEKQKIQIGLQIAPFAISLGHKERDTAALGSYLVNAVGGCNDCHTAPSFAPGGDPFLGQPKAVNKDAYLGGGAAFGPFVTSRNLTPDANGEPAGLSYAEFVEAIRFGKDEDEVHGPGVPLQVMPWPVYQSMTDRDLQAIYTYLGTIPCLEGDPGVSMPPYPTRCN